MQSGGIVMSKQEKRHKHKLLAQSLTDTIVQNVTVRCRIKVFSSDQKSTKVRGQQCPHTVLASLVSKSSEKYSESEKEIKVCLSVGRSKNTERECVFLSPARCAAGTTSARRAPHFLTPADLLH